MDNTTGSLEEVLGCPNPEQQPHQEKRPPKPVPEQSLKCPRCESTNTKFCYYNNYSLSQPRYFCKSCRRYWTQGGTLRNIPVGGGCRKNNRRTTPIRRTPTTPPTLQQDQTTTISSSYQVGPTPHSYYYDGYGCFSGLFNQAGPAGFLEILRGGGGYVENNGMESSGYYGYVEERGNVELGGGKPELGLEYGRDCWGGGVASSFHGLLNSSMI